MTDAMDQAARWYARLNGGAPDESRAAFDEWRQASPRNAQAWAALDRVQARLDAAADAPELHRMIAAARTPGATATPAHRSFTRIAAGLALVATVGAATLFSTEWLAFDRPATAVAARFTTATGEKRSVTLADGTVMTLNTDTAVALPRWTAARNVRIERGEAFFIVAKDASRPFVVQAGGNSVTALGTRFSAHMDEGRFEVALVEGKVRVDIPADKAEHLLAPGNVLTVDRQGTRISTDAAERTTGWLKGQLAFDNATLATVVTEMNRYSKRKLVLGSPALGKTPVSGVFHTGDVDSLARALEGYRVARIDVRDKDHIVLTAF